MSVYKRPDSPFYHYDFQYRGGRFSGSTKESDRRKAEAFERAERERARRAAAEPAPPPSRPEDLTFGQAAALYQDAIGDDPGADTPTGRNLERLVVMIGPQTPVVDIDDTMVATLIAERRMAYRWDKPVMADGSIGQRLSNATINRLICVQLRPILRHVRSALRIALPNEPDWARLRLPESKGRTRELTGAEEERIEAAEREDFRPARLFAQITALRLREVVGLTWQQIDFWNREIRVIGKGDKLHVLPMTKELLALLEPLRGHHPTSVFTYVAQRTYHNKKAGRTYVAGQRYPITRSGLTSRRKRDFAKAVVEDFKWHDLRHTGISRMLRRTGNLRAAQELANHSTVRMTERYTHVTNDDLRRAMEAVSADQAARRKSREKSRDEDCAPDSTVESNAKSRA